jgi:hypothetical protein
MAAGVNVKALSTFMGHANIRITLDQYGHLLPGSEDEAAGAARRLPGAPGGRRRRRADCDQGCEVTHTEALERFTAGARRPSGTRR